MCLHQANDWVFCQQAPPRAEAILGTSDPAQISLTGCATTRNPEMHRLAHVSSHVFDAFEKCGYGIQSHAGTLAAFTLRSTLDVYTQAITGANAPQAAVLSWCFRGKRMERRNRRQVTLQREEIDTARRHGPKRDTKKGAETCPFGSSMVS